VPAPDPAASSRPSFTLRAPAGGLLIIRLTVVSRMMASAVVRPRLDAWVLPDGRLAEPRVEVAPATVYLAQNQEARLTLTTSLPADLEPGDRLRGGLRLPGIEQESLGLELEVLPADQGEPSREHQISIILPLSGYELGDRQAQSTQAITRLVAALAGMEVIPAKWVVAEMLLTVCEVGAEYAETAEGSRLLERLSRLRFFKNGVLAFRGAHLPNWIMVAVSISSGLQSALGGRDSQGRLLHTWEKWLLDLMEIDIEDAGSEGREVHLPPPDLERSLARLGTTAETWFGALLLGLARLSPRLRDVFDHLAERAPEPPAGAAPEPAAEPGDVLSEEGSIQR
jgi:hypothetical protein